MSTPEVIVDAASFTMTGVCTPENPPKFFEQFDKKTRELFDSKHTIEMTFHLDYFNTGSSKCLLNIFRDMAEKKNNIKVNWIYEKGDEEMREAGELYAEIAEMQFDLIEK